MSSAQNVLSQEITFSLEELKKRIILHYINIHYFLQKTMQRTPTLGMHLNLGLVEMVGTSGQVRFKRSFLEHLTGFL